MSRTILFRGKRLDSGEWVTGSYVHDIEWAKYSIFQQELRGAFYRLVEYSVKPETVGEFTGFKLRSGKYLFENDILFDEIEEDEGDRRIFYVVTWVKERGAFALLDTAEYTEYKENGIDGISRNFEGFYYELDRASILRMHYAGNLHDHPHLLNKQTSNK